MARIDDLIKEQEKKLKPKTDANIAEYTKENNALKEQVNASLDASAEASAGLYRQEIEQAPLDSRIQYDKNAMREAVDRKKIQESLANMGMTDSGLSSSMQTALTVQKSRADNQVRVAEQQRIRAAESMIDQIFANNEQQKALKGIEIDQDTAAYARTQRENAATLATQTATSMYNAEVEAAAQVQAAQVKAQQAYTEQRAKVAQDLIKQGVRTNEAWAQAYEAYPDGSTTEGVKYAKYAQLRRQGYSTASADAMSTVSANAADLGYTAAQTSAALEKALTDTYKQELSKKGMGNLQSVGQADAVPAQADILSTYQSCVQAGLTSEAAAYAVGCYFYNNIMAHDDANANNVGQVLEQCFSGIQLNAALLGAGIAG